MEPVVNDLHPKKTGRRWVIPSVVVVIFAVLGAGSIFVNAATSTSSLWSTNTVPKTISASDNKAVELGVRFKASVAGEVTGVRFYKGAQNTGTHTGQLWDNQGDLLAEATFTNESSSGWQTVSFAQPVQIAANVPYVVSYYAPKGHYSYNDYYFTKARTKGNLTAPANSSTVGNGVYIYTSGTAFPTQTYRADNYWVDVLFSTKIVGSTAKPAPPTSVQATQSGSGIVLTWPAASSANPIKNYAIIRNGSQIATVGATTLTYTDTSLTAAKTYSYQVETIDNAGSVSVASPTATVTYNVSPTPTPTPSGTFVKPGTVGYLGATSALTVYQPGGAAPSGCSWISYGLRCDQDDITWDHVWIKGSVYWTGVGNLTLTNSIVQGGDNGEWYALLGHPSNTGTINSTITVTDSTVGWLPGKTPPPGQDVAPVWALYGNQRQIVERSDLSGMAQGIDPTDGSIIKDNWIHGLVQNSTDPNNPTHLDGIYSQGGGNITITGNYVDVPARSDTTAAVFIQDRGSSDTGISITNNYLTGGAFTLRNQTGINVDVENNVFGQSVWGPVGDLNAGYVGTFGTWSGNVQTDGTVIAKP